MTDATIDGGPQVAPGADDDQSKAQALKDKAQSVVSNVASNVSDKADVAKAKAGDIASTASDQAAVLKDKAGEVGRNVADKAMQAKDWAGEQAGVARDWALDQGDVLRDTVQTKPFIAVGVSAASAFAAGLILGVLLTRR